MALGALGASRTKAAPWRRGRGARRGGGLDLPPDKAQRAEIARAEFARDGDALQTERQMRDEIGERGIGARPASGRIDDQAYAMTALGLAAATSST